MSQSGSEELKLEASRGDRAKAQAWIRRAGIVLFIASFLVPSAWPGGKWNFGSGAMAFCGAAVGLLGAICRPPAEWQAHQIFSTTCLALAFLANFIVFFHFGRTFRWCAILAPWAALGCSAAVWSFTPFYFWAIGIGLILASRYRSASGRWNRSKICIV